MSLAEDSVRESRKRRREAHEAGLKGINRYKTSTSGSTFVKKGKTRRNAYGVGSSFSE